MYTITTFYRFVDIATPEKLKQELFDFCKHNEIKGTIILAHEGINATLIGKDDNIKRFYQFIASYANLQNLFFQETFAVFMPFQKLKIKIKPEIVTFKTKNLDMSNTGEYLDPERWDDLILNQEAKTIDTRNYYEVAMGSFKNAINPNINNFSELIDWVDHNLDKNNLEQPIGMFCTGGVRCEKSTAYLKQSGYKNVYHLKGGIINYLNSKKATPSTWEGNCFIFDDRVSLNASLAQVNP